MTTTADNPVTINIGAACKGNPGPGGWGVVIARNGRSLELCGGDFYTSSHEMELTAVINALEALKRPLPVQLLTNSTYIVESMTKWVQGWQASGWRKARGEPVANAELWKRIVELAATHQVEWVWVRGHSSNERAVQLANQGISKAN